MNAQQHIQVTGDFGLYTLLARIVPVYLVLLPVGIIMKVWLLGNSLEGTIGALLAGPIAISMFLGEFGRDQGYRKQDRLWASWGGAPTTQLLRHRNSNVNPLIRRGTTASCASSSPIWKCQPPKRSSKIRVQPIMFMRLASASLLVARGIGSSFHSFSKRTSATAFEETFGV